MVGIALPLSGYVLVQWAFDDGCVLEITGQDHRPGYRIELPPGKVTVNCPHGLTIGTLDLGPAVQRPA